MKCEQPVILSDSSKNGAYIRVVLTFKRVLKFTPVFSPSCDLGDSVIKTEKVRQIEAAQKASRMGGLGGDALAKKGR